MSKTIIKQMEAVEIERKRYHKQFCQERQRVIDSKPTKRAEERIKQLEAENKKLKECLEELCIDDCGINLEILCHRDLIDILQSNDLKAQQALKENEK